MSVGFQKQPWFGGRIRRTPWWLRLLGEKPYRMWLVAGPLPAGSKPDRIKPGCWLYFGDKP